MNNSNSSNVYLDSSEEFHCYPSFTVFVESIIFVFSYRKRFYISFSTGGHFVKVESRERHEAHQKHEEHNRKFTLLVISDIIETKGKIPNDYERADNYSYQK